MPLRRREFIKTAGSALVLGAAEGALAGGAASADLDAAGSAGRGPGTARPNIVLIMADQLAAGFVGCYGSGVESTPTLDRLAQSGARFSRCYAHAPVCGPNRAAIFTGRSAEVNGIVTNDLVLRKDTPTFAQVLKDSGYCTGGFGKFHFTPWQEQLPHDMSEYGFQESVRCVDSRLGAWLDWIEAEHPDHYEMALATCFPMAYLSEYGDSRRDLRGAWNAARAKHVNPLVLASEWRSMYPSPLPAELYPTTFITDVAIDFMDRHTRGAEQGPFFCFVSYLAPHHPYDPPAPYSRMYAPEDMPPPIPMAVDSYGYWALEAFRDVAEVRGLGVDTIRKARAYYHGSVRLIDDQVARIEAFLRDRNLLDSTIVVFTTDHGDMMGDHGFFFKGIMHYDSCARLPLIVHGPGVRQVVADRLLSSLDLYPAICDWAGVERRPPIEGRSFAACAAGDSDETEWDAVTVQYCGARSIVTQDGWRLSLYDQQGEGQMFALRDDPHEQKDLFHDVTGRDKLLELCHLHARAYMRMGFTLQHRNLPVTDGRYVAYNDAFGFDVGLPDQAERRDALGFPSKTDAE